ncbi:hypothetical protein PtA15_11A277 [Puccinia triticina]|uniref:Uncharacterized protein n=1 Tax=Puccinia triticina TaxID=208348 RepID=A0ABY7CYT9_9BASI|nr:uncharacterized protein PtA15_11A277 [Puccinia triticina]WAQ89587.1 hypothetical protein PtA15_11A277 [Puccinia triticina]
MRRRPHKKAQTATPLPSSAGSPTPDDPEKLGVTQDSINKDGSGSQLLKPMSNQEELMVACWLSHPPSHHVFELHNFPTRYATSSPHTSQRLNPALGAHSARPHETQTASTSSHSTLTTRRHCQAPFFANPMTTRRLNCLLFTPRFVHQSIQRVYPSHRTFHYSPRIIFQDCQTLITNDYLLPRDSRSVFMRSSTFALPPSIAT